MLHINKVDHLNLTVENYKETLAFYKDIFGMEVFESGEASYGPYEIIGIPGKLFLCIYKGAKRETGSVNHLGINILDFEKAKTELIKRGIELHYGGVVDYPQSRSLYIEDPDGNSIELSEVFAGGLGA